MRWVARALWRLGQGAFAAAATDYLSVVSGCVRGIQATGAARAWDAEVVGRGVARAGCPGVFGETRWRGRLGYKRLHRCSNLIIWAVLHLRLQHQTAAAAPWRDANGVGELPGRRHHQLAGAAAEGMAIGMSAAPLRMFAARRAASCCLTFSFCYLTSFFAHGELSASFGFFFFSSSSSETDATSHRPSHDVFTNAVTRCPSLSRQLPLRSGAAGANR